MALPGEPGRPDSSGGLQAGLKNRHLPVIAIGGVIGAGLFVGSSAGIAAAGPPILLSYAMAGLMAVLVMRMFGEMAAARPSSGTYVAALDVIGIPHAGQVMDFIVLTAVLSCLDSGLHTASRMAFSLGERETRPHLAVPEGARPQGRRQVAPAERPRDVIHT